MHKAIKTRLVAMMFLQYFTSGATWPRMDDCTKETPAYRQTDLPRSSTVCPTSTNSKLPRLFTPSSIVLATCPAISLDCDVYTMSNEAGTYSGLVDRHSDPAGSAWTSKKSNDASTAGASMADPFSAYSQT